MIEQEIAYKKPTPPEWDQLIVRFADIAANGNGPIEQAEEGFGIIAESLDQNARERNRYHGLGLVTCRFSQILADQEVRQGVIELSGRHLASTLQPEDRGVLRLKHLRKDTIRYGMSGVVRGAFSEQPAGHGLLLGVLTAVSFEEALREHPVYVNNPQLLHADAVGLVGRLAARDFYDSVVAGASRSFREAVMVVAAERGYQNAANYPLPHNEWLRDAASDLYIPSTNAARVRIDKFNRAPYYIEREGVDGWRTNMNQFQEPESLDPAKTFHAETHGCPALYVRGAIRQMLGIYAGVVIHARQLLVDGTPSGSDNRV